MGVLKPKTREETQAPPKNLPLEDSSTPFSDKGRKGSLGVLKPKTREGMQGLPKNPPLEDPPTPFSHTGRRGSLGVLMPETGDGARGLSKKLRLRAFFYTGRGRSLFVLKPKE